MFLSFDAFTAESKAKTAFMAPLKVKSAIAAAAEFDSVYKYRGSQDHSYLENQSRSSKSLKILLKQKHRQLHFYITNIADFLFLISENDSRNFLPVLINMNYLENGLDSIYKTLA